MLTEVSKRNRKSRLKFPRKTNYKVTLLSCQSCSHGQMSLNSGSFGFRAYLLVLNYAHDPFDSKKDKTDQCAATVSF